MLSVQGIASQTGGEALHSELPDSAERFTIAFVFNAPRRWGQATCSTCLNKIRNLDYPSSAPKINN